MATTLPPMLALFWMGIGHYHSRALGLAVPGCSSYRNLHRHHIVFIRTSVDHGTALDLAADAAKARTADPGSLYAAVDLALELATHRGG